MDFELKAKDFRLRAKDLGPSAVLCSRAIWLDLQGVARHDVFPVANVPPNCMDKADHGFEQWKA